MEFAMLRKFSLIAGGLVFALATVFVISGCSNSGNDAPKGEARNGSPKNKDVSQKDNEKKEEHGHKAGAHGGIIVSLSAGPCTTVPTRKLTLTQTAT